MDKVSPFKDPQVTQSQFFCFNLHLVHNKVVDKLWNETDQPCIHDIPVFNLFDHVTGQKHHQNDHLVVSVLVLQLLVQLLPEQPESFTDTDLEQPIDLRVLRVEICDVAGSDQSVYVLLLVNLLYRTVLGWFALQQKAN
jgi:hypothetical protein